MQAIMERKSNKSLLGGLALVLAVAAVPTALDIRFGQAEEARSVETTSDGYPLYQNDPAIQLPVMFSLNHDLVSDSTDMFGYCLSVSNHDVECYTMKGRFLGVGSVELYSDGNLSAVHVIDKAPAEYRQVMTNAFLRVWG